MRPDPHFSQAGTCGGGCIRPDCAVLGPASQTYDVLHECDCGGASVARLVGFGASTTSLSKPVRKAGSPDLGLGTRASLSLNDPAQIWPTESNDWYNLGV